MKYKLKILISVLLLSAVVVFGFSGCKGKESGLSLEILLLGAGDQNSGSSTSDPGYLIQTPNGLAF